MQIWGRIDAASMRMETREAWMITDALRRENRGVAKGHAPFDGVLDT